MVKVGIHPDPADRERLKAIRESFGIARGAPPFVREKRDRF